MNIDLILQREELEGCLHLGMEREALRLAKFVPAKERWQFDL